MGWFSYMVGVNINGLKKIYGEDLVNKIKGCKFHCKESINKKAKQRRKKGDDFKTFANEWTDIIGWLKWWDERRISIFRTFKG